MFKGWNIQSYCRCTVLRHFIPERYATVELKQRFRNVKGTLQHLLCPDYQVFHLLHSLFYIPVIYIAVS
jgi:hypothetical protein